ncbi:S41 family peptidase [Ideonella sp.]|uniref:S41 family peptidase n=1 Tax=Ideonella sp. TaxID=1929293 RepID=UPI003BB6D315
MTLKASLTVLAGAMLAALITTSTQAATPLGPVQQPLWLRSSAISPDGSQIVFGYQGNLYRVATAGGAAQMLVANGAHSREPVWSPDGQTIAYASDAHGNFDVFLVSASGGPSRRLTANSTAETPIGFTPDGKEVLFSAQRMDARSSLAFPSPAMSELYKVGIDGNRRPVQVMSSPALAGQLDAKGQRLLYEDWKGYENDWRKHHVSPVARDVWLYDAKTGQHRQLTGFGGEDRNPVWSPDEQSVYYLSEKSGSFNVWKMPLNAQGQADGAAVQVTRFATHPVRYLSMARNGTLSFSYDGELYTLAAGADQPRKLSVQIAGDTRSNRIEQLKISKGLTEIAVRPDGEEVAFVARGEVFVTSTEYGDTRRITDTPTQERSVSFSPDGRRLLFAGERNGRWNLYEASLPGSKKDTPVFYAAPEVTVRTLLSNDHENFQPRYSPDGKEVAYLEDRTTVKVLNIASGKTRTVLPSRHNYSYADGDMWFDWSPDGQSLLVQFVDGKRWSNEVGLIDAQGKGPLLNLTQNGYEDIVPVFTHGGKAVMWRSDRAGLHATGGTAHFDLFGLSLTLEDWERSKLDKAAFALLKKREDEDKADKDKEKDKEKEKAGKDKPADKSAKAGKDEDAITLPPPVVIDRDGLEDRIQRLTPNSGEIRTAAMTPDGEAVYYVLLNGDSNELWVNRPRSKEASRVAVFPAGPRGRGADAVDLQLDAKGETAFLLLDGAVHKFKLPKEPGDVKPEPVKFAAEMRLDKAAERAYFFDHAWRQTRDKLYVADMGGVDWVAYRKAYERFLPHIADNHDFAEMLSELLGELNVSHTGSGYRAGSAQADVTASLGAFIDERHTGPGLKIAEVIEGGPLASVLKGSKPLLKAGQVIEAIDGVTIAAGQSEDELLNRKVEQRVLLSVFDPASGQRSQVTVLPINPGELNELLYKRWVKAQRELVDKLSAGRLGYVHVRGMDDESYRTVFGEVLGRHSGKQGLIVDTRFNGGGNLHDELSTLLSGKRYLEFVPRGQSLGWEPVGRWNQPSVVLISESNYSDAHLFPWVYRHLGIGKLVGMPVAGTGTAVWWETLQDPSLYFGIPMVGFRDAKGEYMEKALVEPDIRVANDPALLQAGRDQQLEAAVQSLLKP